MSAGGATSAAEEADLIAGQAVFGCELIQQMGILLRLPQVAVSTAQVSFHRFYAKRSMRKFDVRVSSKFRVVAANYSSSGPCCTFFLDFSRSSPTRLRVVPSSLSPQYIALGALFLATKVEECPKKLRDVLQVFIYLEQKRQGVEKPTPVDIHSNRFSAYKDRLIRAERELLKELGFVLYTEHPHKFILNYAKLLTLDDATFKKLAQYAWNFINDSQRTDVCMRYPPETICCAALWMGARVLQIKLPSSSEPPWWELFDAKREDMDAVCERVTALYSRPRATFIDLYAQSQQAAAAAPPPSGS